jgi:hypothetical protein
MSEILGWGRDIPCKTGMERCASRREGRMWVGAGAMAPGRRPEPPAIGSRRVSLRGRHCAIAVREI